jgi:HEAT repeat protein
VINLFSLKTISVTTCALLIAGCMPTGKPKEQVSEVEKMYQEQRYEDAMNIARYNLNQNPKDIASIIVVWKIQVLQGTKSIDYVQSFYSQAQAKVKEFGPALIPYLGQTLTSDPYNTVRLFALYALSEFPDTTADQYIIKLFAPDYMLGYKPSNVAFDFMRSEAAMILGVHKYSPAFADISGMLKNPDLEIQAKAAQALGLLGDKRAIPALEELVKTSPKTGNGKFAAEMADTAIAKINRAP